MNGQLDQQPGFASLGGEPFLREAGAARKEPWYADPSKIAGVLGFVLALGTLGERMWVRDQEQTLQRLQQLREATGEAADIQYEYLEALTRAPSNIYALGVAKNTKRQMQIQTAVALLDFPAVKRQASPQILGALGAEMTSDGRYEDARRFYLDALARLSDTDTLRPYILRGLGQLHRVPNTSLTSVPTARDYFQQALKLLDARADDAGRLATAETLLSEASLEVTYGDSGQTKELVAQARERLQKVRTESPLKAQLSQISSVLDRGEQYSTSPPATVGQTSPADSAASRDTVSIGLRNDGKAAALQQTVIDVWPPVPGQVSGVDMAISIDGKAIGQVSNLREPHQIGVPALDAGVHTFSFTNLRPYFIDPAKGPTTTGQVFSCAGFFELSASGTVLKANVGSGPLGLMCALQ